MYDEYGAVAKICCSPPKAADMLECIGWLNDTVVYLPWQEAASDCFKTLSHSQDLVATYTHWSGSEDLLSR